MAPDNVPNAQLSTTTITSGTIGYTSTLNATSGAVTSSYDDVDVPVLSTTTTYSGSKTLATTVAESVSGIAETTFVIVDLPVLSTETITSGTSAHTITVTTMNMSGVPTT